MKLIEVTDYRELVWQVPGSLKDLVNYLNSLLIADPVAITKLIHFQVPCDEEKIELRELYLITCGTKDQPQLSVLNLLSGFVNTSKYRICASFADIDPTGYQGNILKFSVVKVAEDDFINPIS